MEAVGGDNANSGGGGTNTGGAGASTGGSGDTVTQGGGGILTPKGAGSTGNDPASGKTPNANNSNPDNTSGKQVSDWKLSLSPELQESSALKLINDIPSLAKSYVNAQKLIGADKIALPSKHATPEEWRDVYHKLGLPQDVKDYKINVDANSPLSKEFAPQFAAKAHELGILPSQAQALLGHFETMNQTAITNMTKSQKDAEVVGLKKLQGEWGEAYNEKINQAQAAVAHFADPETVKYLDDTGLTNDINLIKLFSKVATVLKEDGIIKESAGTGGRLTPNAAKEAYGVILSNLSHPYYIKEHPGHKAALAEVTGLFQAASATKAR
jgi:hypothetical protein